MTDRQNPEGGSTGPLPTGKTSPERPIVSRAVMQHAFDIAAHHGALGIRYLEHGNDWILMDLPFSEHLVAYPDIGVVAGGALYALLDSANGYAIFTHDSISPRVATLDLRVDYLKPIPPGVTLKALGRVVKRTRTVVFTQALAYTDSPDRPLARATGTFVLDT